MREAELKRWIAHTPLTDPTYLPDDDLRILNIISWKNISQDDIFGGGRSGKKFYPTPPAFSSAHMIPNNANPVYILCKGFFTSMRPGAGSLLLNINPVTTAFYPAVRLQDWMIARWPGADGIPPANGLHELEGLRVTFEGDPLIPPK